MHFGGMGGGMGGARFAAIGGGPRFGGFAGPRFAGGRFAGAHFAHGHFFHHRFNRFAFFGFPGVYASYGYYDDGCWTQVWTRYGWQSVNVCGNYGYY
jgi:hypothetical protein